MLNLLNKQASSEQIVARCALMQITTLLTLGQTDSAIPGNIRKNGNFLSWMIHRRLRNFWGIFHHFQVLTFILNYSA